jgi:FKBP-type peptidyl-prolyl cis-trans isomerase FklB
MKTKIILLSVCFSIPALFSCNGQKGKGSVSLKTREDSVAYGIGVSIGTNMKKDEIDKLNTEILIQAMRASLSGDSLLMDNATSINMIQAYLGDKQKEKSEAAREEGRKFLEENKSKPGVKTTNSGLQYLVEKEGTGPMPLPTDTVVCHYHGTLIDGTVFDSSVERGQPAEFPLNGVIPGWTEALQLMKVGSKWKLFIPSELAYGDRQMGPKIKPNSTLIFEVELLSIKGKK